MAGAGVKGKAPVPARAGLCPKVQAVQKRRDLGAGPGLGWTGPMNVEPKLHRIATAMTDARRARMLCTLLDGRAFANKELASGAGITPQTASGHLAQLQEAGPVVAEKIRRNVYHRLAGDQVVGMLESLGRLAPMDHLQRARMARAQGAV